MQLLAITDHTKSAGSLKAYWYYLPEFGVYEVVVTLGLSGMRVWSSRGTLGMLILETSTITNNWSSTHDPERENRTVAALEAAGFAVACASSLCQEEGTAEV